DLDKKVHREGPNHRQHLLEIDRQPSALLSSFGSWEKALNQCIFILLGDRAQTQVKAAEKYQIHLEELLKGLAFFRRESFWNRTNMTGWWLPTNNWRFSTRQVHPPGFSRS